MAFQPMTGCGTLAAIDSRTSEMQAETHWTSQWATSNWASWAHFRQIQEHSSWDSNLGPWMKNENLVEQEEMELQTTRLLMQWAARQPPVESLLSAQPQPPGETTLELELPPVRWMGAWLAPEERGRKILDLNNKVSPLPKCPPKPGTTHAEWECKPLPRPTSAPPWWKAMTHDREFPVVGAPSVPSVHTHFVFASNRDATTRAAYWA